MKKVYARVNHGRWIADCPDCSNGAMLVNPEKLEPFICGNCFPGMVAKTIKKVGEDKYVPVPDDKTIFRTAETVMGAGYAYEVVIPDNWSEIFETLRPRLLENMNWQPGETLDDLIEENIEHKVT